MSDTPKTSDASSGSSPTSAPSSAGTPGGPPASSNRTAEGDRPTKTPYQKYDTVEMLRSQIKNAPYNPRQISERALAKLRKNIRNVGLLQAPIVNRTTGNLVGGHQRLGVIDDLHRGKDYVIEVAVVELDAKTEMEQNVFLNNPEAQGQYDLEKLGLLYTRDKIDPEGTGFERTDLYRMLGDAVFADDAATLKEIADRYEDLRERHRKSVDRIIRRDDWRFYSRLIFADQGRRDAVMEQLGVEDPDYVNGEWWAALATGARPKFDFECDHCRAVCHVPSEATAHRCGSCGRMFEVDWTKEDNADNNTDEALGDSQGANEQPTDRPEDDLRFPPVEIQDGNQNTTEAASRTGPGPAHDAARI